ncbi:MAG: hypothetical protein GX759_07615 [Thermoanaerobacterales bacterium]|nr:hypothetical protein [Thermoanaerobacterales bacterium]
MRNLSSGELTIKIISVIAALVMWLYVMNEQNPNVSYVIRDVPVNFVNLDENRFVLKEAPENFLVNVKVSGRRSIVADLGPDDIYAEVNLKGRMEGENLLHVSVSVPPNVELLDFSPKEILVNLESVIEEQIPVSIDINGTPQNGFAVAKPVAKPGEVLVKGSRSALDSVRSVVAQVDVEDKNSDIVTALQLRAINSKGDPVKGVTFRPETVEIIVPILPVKDVPVTPNMNGVPAEGYIIRNIRTEPSELRITAERDVLQDLQVLNTSQIDISGITRTLTREVPINLPRGVKAFEEEQAAPIARVTVEVEQLVLRELSLSSRNIDIKNLSSALTASVENMDIILTVSGPESIIDKVNEDMFEVFVDVSGLLEGEHDVIIKSEVPEPYTITLTEPDRIKVIISRE